MYEMPDFIGRGEGLQICEIFFASKAVEAVVGCGPMSKNVTIENDGKGKARSFTATTSLLGTARLNQFSSATLQGSGDCPFAATRALRDALETLINRARARLEEIDADLKEGVITR